MKQTSQKDAASPEAAGKDAAAAKKEAPSSTEPAKGDLIKVPTLLPACCRSKLRRASSADCACALHWQQKGLDERAGNPTQAETRAEGHVELHVYLRYLAAWSPMYVIPLGMLASGVVERAFAVRVPCTVRCCSFDSAMRCGGRVHTRRAPVMLTRTPVCASA